MELKTLKIKNETGYYIINEDDFNADIHVLFEEDDDEKKPAVKTRTKPVAL